MNIPWLKAPMRRIFSTQHMVRADLRRGEITASREAYKEALHLALPSVAEMVSMSVIGMADMVMVGRLGSYAVAAVGLTGQPRLIFLSVFMALNVGVTAIVSRRKGENNRADARLCLRQALLLVVGLAILTTALAVAFSEPVMRLAGANEDTLLASTQYFNILSMGMLLQTLSMTICASQRGVGNTRITMTVSITANIVNLICNFLLIEGRFGFPRLEIQGAAIATVIGFGVGLALALRTLAQPDNYLHCNLKDSWKPDLPMLKNIAKIGGGSMIEQLSMRIGFFVYARVVADLGTAAFTAHQIAMQLLSLSFTFADGIAAATTSLVGQNLGKKRPDLSIMFGNIGQRLALVVSAALMTLSLTGRFFFPTLFTDDAAIIAVTADIIIILAFIQPVQTSTIIMAGSLRGAGDTRFVAMTMLFSVSLLRPLISLLFVHGFQWGLTGAWYAILIDMSIRLTMVFTRFSRGRWINIKV